MKWISIESEGKNSKKVERTYKASTKKEEATIDDLSLGFIKFSFIALFVGSTLWIVGEFWDGYTKISQMILLWGFIVTFIMGMSNLIIPDVHHKRVWSRSLYYWQMWIHKIGILLLISMQIALMYHTGAWYEYVRQAGAYLLGLSGLLFFLNIMKST